MKILEIADRVRYRKMTTEELRSVFLLTELFLPGRLDTVYVDLDRTIIGSAVPLADELVLKSAPELRSEYFLERREIGILNIGGTGHIDVDGQRFCVAPLDCLYVGRGAKAVTFRSDDPTKPAEFYLLSYLAHKEYPIRLSKIAELQAQSLGAQESCNKRQIRKHIWSGGVSSSQLVMGLTELESGNVWNTMPPHTHMRRSEVYLYWNLGPEDRILHLLGEPNETRHLLIANKQVVISPGWSIHAGVGTVSYSFCWGMGGENQAYDDMDRLNVSELR
jgi:4-deoxy-L-threo-5-hexosulose-uronate ketol-isomerase